MAATKKTYYSLLSVEYVDADQVDFGVAVFAGFGSGHLDYLAGATLEHHEAVLAERRTLHGEGGRGTGVPGLEVCVLDVTHCVLLLSCVFKTKRSGVF